MSRLAALDLGTNSTRFLCVDSTVAKLTPRTVIARGMEITRLGEGVDANGEIDERAFERVMSTIDRFNETVRRHDGRWVGGLATSACRRADDRSVSSLFDRIESITGIRPEIISGDREGELTYKGVRNSLHVQEGTVIDIGGGSTEWIVFNSNGVESAVSLPLGVVTLNERCVSGDRYTEESVNCMNQEIETLFDPPDPVLSPFVSVGGTGTTLASIDLDLEEYDPETVHGHTLTRSRIETQLNDMLDASFRTLAEHPMIQPGREDVIVPGVKILQAGMSYLNVDRTTVSDFGILAGYLAECME